MKKYTVTIPIVIICVLSSVLQYYQPALWLLLSTTYYCTPDAIVRHAITYCLRPATTRLLPLPNSCHAIPASRGGQITLKSNSDEALNDEFLLKSNGDEALNDGFP